MAARTLIILALLMGCRADAQRYSVDPRLKSIVYEWREDMLEAGLDPDRALKKLREIRVSPLPGDWAGLTNHHHHRITIDPIQLKRGLYSTKHTLYHELGHYAFGLEHGSCKMMGGSGNSEKYYRQHWWEMKLEYIKVIKRCTSTSSSPR